VYFDPVWQVEVELSALERRLLQHPVLRRLGRVSHAGAASFMSVQRYSRLEHSLGLLALVSVLRPADQVMRAAALVHDIGHLPLSHTLEKLTGLDHHDLGAARLQAMSELFATPDVDVHAVIGAVEGRGASRLAGTVGLTLDHFESFVRSAHAHGKTTELPSRTLASIWLWESSVACAPETSAYLKRLALEEAVRQTSRSNARANAVAPMLAARVLSGTTWGDAIPLQEMDDRELWTVLADDPRTAHDFAVFRERPEAWRCFALTGDDQPPSLGCT
jgi:hypothetical protein